jgi:hypothetical protein
MINLLTQLKIALTTLVLSLTALTTPVSPSSPILSGMAFGGYDDPIYSECEIPTKGFDIKIMIGIQEQTSEGNFNDTLYYSFDDWNKKTADDIKADKQKRVDNWLYVLKNPVPIPYIEPTKADLQAEADTLQQQLDMLNAKINEK